MIDCARFRQSMLADPRDPDPRLREHRGSCADCNLFADRLLRFESRLDRALRVAVPAQAVPLRAHAAPTAPRSPAYRHAWLAMAASGVLAFLVAGTLWLSISDRSVAADVVTHMAGEPQAWRRTDVPVPGGELEDVLRNSHVRLGSGAGVVSYASSCEFRGHLVPHLVVQTDSGPVTVMVLVHDRVMKTVRFDEQGYRGVIVPVAGHGSLAVLTRDANADLKSVDEIAARVRASILWTG